MNLLRFCSLRHTLSRKSKDVAASATVRKAFFVAALTFGISTGVSADAPVSWWPDGWQTMEIEAKWNTNDPEVPICDDNRVANPNATYNQIIEAFPDGGLYPSPTRARTYTLNVRFGGISRRYVDVYHDSAGSELSNGLHTVRHRTRYTSRPRATDNCPQTLQEDPWSEKDWERIQYKSTPTRFTPVWFREEAPSPDCNIWDEDNERLCPPSWLGSVDDIMHGDVPDHGAIVKLKQDHPDFDFSTNDPFLEVDQFRYRVEFIFQGEVVHELSLDQVTTTTLATGETEFSVEVEVEVAKVIDGSPRDADDVAELFAIAEQIQNQFGLIPSTTSKGGLTVPESLVVTKTDDTADGVCNEDCSLREAVIAANADTGPHLIRAPSGLYRLTIEGAGEDAASTGDLDITDDLTIARSGAANPIIDGNQLDRVLHIIGTSTTVEIKGLIIKNGHAFEVPGDMNGGGILNLGNLTIADCMVGQNEAERAGGGIRNEGMLMMTSSIVRGNTAGMGFRAEDGGGGIDNVLGGMTTIMDSTISDNNAEGDGGGIRNSGRFDFSRSTRVSIFRSTIIRNTATSFGGGIMNDGPVGVGFFRVENSTIAFNRADFAGGGLANLSEGSIEIANSTIVENTAGRGGGILSPPAETEDEPPDFADVELSNSILANNTAEELTPPPMVQVPLGPDCFGDIDLGNKPSIVKSRIRCKVIDVENPLLIGRDPGLENFTNSGIPGQGYFPLREDSLAINNAKDIFCPEDDQLGKKRPREPVGTARNCDLGSIEFYQIVNDLVALDELSTNYDPVPGLNAPAGRFTITATFNNYSSKEISNPFYEVVILTGDNMLLNADGGAGGAGSTLTPDVGDEVLSPGESVEVDFVIGLQTTAPFRFFVNVRGVPNP
jgi:CSLREA domain-containing protein